MPANALDSPASPSPCAAGGANAGPRNGGRPHPRRRARLPSGAPTIRPTVAASAREKLRRRRGLDEPIADQPFTRRRPAAASTMWNGVTMV